MVGALGRPAAAAVSRCGDASSTDDRHRQPDDSSPPAVSPAARRSGVPGRDAPSGTCVDQVTTGVWLRPRCGIAGLLEDKSSRTPGPIVLAMPSSGASFDTL